MRILCILGLLALAVLLALATDLVTHALLFQVGSVLYGLPHIPDGLDDEAP